MKSIVDQTRRHLQRLLPGSQQISIKVDRDREKNFITRIHVQTPRKQLHACKIGPDLHSSLDRASQALRRQIERLKTRRRKSQERLGQLLMENLEIF